MAGIIYYKNGAYFTNHDGYIEAFEELVAQLSIEAPLHFDETQEIAFIGDEQLEFAYLDGFSHIGDLC